PWKDGPLEDMLHFMVKDSGIGIPLESQKRIFESFTQVDSSVTRKYGGTGLGLTISSRLVSLMGGKIWLESEPGKGSTFHFTARFAKCAEDDGDRSGSGSDFSGLRALVVDDDPINLRIIGDMIGRWGIAFDLANSAAEALSKLEDGECCRYDVLLVDQQMPEMDGLSLVRKLRANEAGKKIPVVVLSSITGYPGKDLREELSISATLNKPINYLDLLNVLGSLYRRSCKDKKSDGPPMDESYRILLVEDHPINQKLAVSLLRKRSHVVEVANNGEEAVDILSRGDFDLVLMDVQMPVMDGIEATARIRDPSSSVREHSIPIIAMTAHAMQGDKENCLNAGMDGYVSKPLNFEEMFKEIDRVMDESRGKCDG
ncbi:MAG: response regulator, partial [Candidatus Thermoplasmatota archaeon]|nr:response regulator [Candidatus Thermoplasmatota archaeon]